ncbi:DnaD and phage-associated domain-containing protein [Virgibacillus subterraneus]|uniref:DnaD and phage-associated domain-containing protein n=1 Tax=Virgibacillus subterraneus TaxID=621109 RepID=A0A1H9GB09_9BACI|nr:DnaD domain protein [Virgibacillus subterraneus]SEQ47297.1 DnaD and phage-associated domain-containing protein [Virgibacillus subterraneus]
MNLHKEKDGTMNYIKEINAFYDHIERNPLSASAVTLWHALIHINNKAMWAESFTVAAPVLRLKSGLTDSSFKRARTELKEKGYINYQSRGKNQAPVYQMVSLTLGMDIGMNMSVDLESDPGVDGYLSHHTDQDANQPMNQVVDHHTDHGKDPLIKQKKDKKKRNNTKRNDTAATTDVFVFYQENFGVINPFVSDALQNWLNDMGEDLVLDAMKRALVRGKGNWCYVQGILQAWVKKGITSVEAAKAEQVEFRRNQQRQQRSYVAGTEEVVPGWFKEQKRKEKLKREQEKLERKSRNTAAEREEVERLLAAYRERGGTRVG